MAFTSYVDGEPLAEAGGRVTQLGLKPGITDVGEGNRSDATLRSMADGWASELDGLREQLAAIVPPDDLAGAHRELAAALDGYVAVADLLGQAAGAQDQERRDLVADAAARGEASDRVWDRGAAAIQARARELGLDPVPWLPVPDALP